MKIANKELSKTPEPIYNVHSPAVIFLPHLHCFPVFFQIVDSELFDTHTLQNNMRNVADNLEEYESGGFAFIATLKAAVPMAFV